ncbi:uncharacterized protein LOC131657779 [Vicia villosa]|uniref:uncharacterized protein LOC131657779 n=1 Tax=Vicia villosa TaxID=3911 RepID=UPI00273C7583|nr:uncharacterized protein LOC131657779 [Vicia villosa]
MLGDGGETPSRYELLSMVKKHSNLIGRTVVEDQEDAPDVEMDMKFWNDVFDLYFVRGKESRGRQDDDLVSRGSASNNDAKVLILILYAGGHLRTRSLPISDMQSGKDNAGTLWSNQFKRKSVTENSSAEL